MLQEQDLQQFQYIRELQLHRHQQQFTPKILHMVQPTLPLADTNLKIYANDDNNASNVSTS